MVQIDLDLDGDESLQAEFEDLEDKGTTDRVYSVGTNTEYGSILEFGRGPIEAPEGSAIPIETESGTIFRKRVSGHPPYPWFRPAIREFEANPRSFVENSDAFEFSALADLPNADMLLLSIAASLVDQMEKNVTATESAGRSPGTHPDHPQRDSGNLVNDIDYQRIQ